MASLLPDVDKFVAFVLLEAALVVLVAFLALLIAVEVVAVFEIALVLDAV